MSADPELLKQFEKKFSAIKEDGKPPRPELAGFTRIVRHVHQVEQAVTRLHRAMVKGAQLQVPEGPKSAYERWEEIQEDAELDALFGDIYAAAPKALGFDTN